MNKKFIAFMITLLFAMLSLAACTKPAPPVPDMSGVSLSGEYDVVLFSGQSNMVGRDTTKYAVDIPEGTAFEYRYKSNDFVSVENPTGEAFSASTEHSSGSSMVPAFCEKWVKETGRKIIVVHIACGGLDISHFTSDEDIYKDILKKYQACLDKLEEEDVSIGKQFYVFYQGESDTANGCTTEQYKERYLSFHNSIKDEFGFDFGAMIYVGKDMEFDEDGIRRINAAKKELAEEHEDIIVCEKSPALMYRDGREYLRITNNDDTHLNAEGLKMVGTSSAENIIKYLGRGTDTSQEGVDPITYLPEPNYDIKLSGEYDVILFTGQSNMVGKETDCYTVDIPEGAAFEYNSNNDILVPVKNPVGEGMGMALNGSSIVPAFCEKWVKDTGRKVIVVHVAREGMDLSHFTPPDGDIYGIICEKLEGCFCKLEEENISIGKKFYVYYQGESDTTNNSTAEQYKDGFMSFHNAMKDEFGFEFGATLYVGKNTQLNEDGIRLINAVKKELAEEHEDIIVCEKLPALMYRDGREYLRIDSDDDTHLNAEGLKTVGTSSAENIIKYLGLGADTSQKGVDPVTYLPEPNYEKMP